jgi:REP element-mobilizing transposase RayT
MSRSLRVQYPGAIYHVTSRGSRRAPIVLDDEDRGQFWSRIGETVVKYGWEMFAAALMTNHFHLFFRTPQPNLSRGMQYLLGGYARWYNQRHRTVGHVFQGRFRGHIIENESYFWTVSRYVHLNPVPVIVSRPADWPWSTYAGYLNPQRRWDWVAYDTLLSAWQGSFGGPSAIEGYRSFVEGQGDDHSGDPFAEAIDGWILGSQEFAERIRKQLQPSHRRPRLARRLTTEQLVTAVCRHFEMPQHELRVRSSRHPARPIFACLAKRYTDATLRELAPLLGVARADCVPHLVARAARAEPDSEIGCALIRIEQQLR